MNSSAWLLSDFKKIPKNNIKVMSTFSCDGGSTMGYKLAGCEVIAANDIDPQMAKHYKTNFNTKHYFLCPIKNLVLMDLPQELFNLDILDGSPPCSTFSMAGGREKTWGKNKIFREGQSKQVLSDLFFDFLDLAERLKPKVIIAENVQGLIYGNARGYTKLIIERLKDCGYNPQLFLLNSADCGVPQCRRRVFFCAARKDLNALPLVLSPTHRWISAGEAIEDLKDLTAEEIIETKLSGLRAKYWEGTIPGKSLSFAVERYTGKRSWFNHFKQNKNHPAITLTTNQLSLLHWEECRKFTFREWKRFGSFPDDYKADNDRIGRYMVGMSVPPKMAEAVARAVCDQWLATNY